MPFMPTNVAIPGLGESVSEAVLLKWHKRDGERVTTTTVEVKTLAQMQVADSVFAVPANYKKR